MDLQTVLASIQTIYSALAFHFGGSNLNAGAAVQQNRCRYGFLLITGATWVVIAWPHLQIEKIKEFVGIGELTIVHSKTFSNEVVELDGYFYQDCTFRNVTFQYNGGMLNFSHNQIIGDLKFESKNKDINSAFVFLARFGLLRIPVFDDKGALEPGVSVPAPVGH